MCVCARARAYVCVCCVLCVYIIYLTLSPPPHPINPTPRSLRPLVMQAVSPSSPEGDATSCPLLALPASQESGHSHIPLARCRNQPFVRARRHHGGTRPAAWLPGTGRQGARQPPHLSPRPPARSTSSVVVSLTVLPFIFGFCFSLM